MVSIKEIYDANGLQSPYDAMLQHAANLYQNRYQNIETQGREYADYEIPTRQYGKTTYRLARAIKQASLGNLVYFISSHSSAMVAAKYIAEEMVEKFPENVMRTEPSRSLNSLRILTSLNTGGETVGTIHFVTIGRFDSRGNLSGIHIADLD